MTDSALLRWSSSFGSKDSGPVTDRVRKLGLRFTGLRRKQPCETVSMPLAWATQAHRLLPVGRSIGPSGPIR